MEIREVEVREAIRDLTRRTDERHLLGPVRRRDRHRPVRHLARDARPGTALPQRPVRLLGAVRRFADVEAAHRDPATYSSAHGTVLELMSPEPLPTAQIIFLDPPEHTRLRALVSCAFSPRRVTDLEGTIRRICRELFDDVDGRDFDYLQDFAALLPSRVISSLFGVPDSDRERVGHLFDQIFHIEPDVGMVNDVSLTAQIASTSTSASRSTPAVTAPANDMLTDLALAEITEDGTTRTLKTGEAADFALLVVGAGTETVACLLGWAAVLLDRHPDQRCRARGRPGSPSERGRGAAALRGALTGAGSLDDPRRRAPRHHRPRGLEGVAPDRVGRTRRARGTPTRRASTSRGASTTTCRSASGSTSAWARPSPGSSRASPSRRPWRVYPEWSVDHEHAVRLHSSTVRGYTSVPISV